jgi:hypothetical protein
MRKIILSVGICYLVFSMLGCEAFARKFTRKSKKEKEPVEMVLAPEEYKGPQMSKEEIYRKYLLYWQSWHDELINSLSSGGSTKKHLDCLNEAVKNLSHLRLLLNAEKQKGLDVYIGQLNSLKDSIAGDIYNTDTTRNSTTAERIKRAIMRHFSYKDIKDYLI